MKIPGLKSTSPLLKTKCYVSKDRIKQYNNLDATAYIEIVAAVLRYNSEYDKEACRPYLSIHGFCNRIDGDFPEEITQLNFNENERQFVDIQYDFSDDELSVMTKQGLFREGFKVPEDFVGHTIDIPVTLNLSTIDIKEKFPMAFAEIQRPHHIVINAENSAWQFGYEFDAVEYIPHEERVIEKDYYIEIDDFDKSNDLDFGDYENEEVAEVDKAQFEADIESELESNEEFREALKDIIQRVEDKKARASELIEEKLQEKQNAESDLVFDASDIDDVLEADNFEESLELGDESEAEKDAEKTRRLVQKVDRANDLQEEINNEERLRDAQRLVSGIDDLDTLFKDEETPEL